MQLPNERAQKHNESTKHLNSKQKIEQHQLHKQVPDELWVSGRLLQPN